ncbi:hypothetical protein KGQ71_03430 [Patescibacteria group bacterium]|nr:hypothetical protein [Patescibacteria group bacterium]
MFGAPREIPTTNASGVESSGNGTDNGGRNRKETPKAEPSFHWEVGDPNQAVALADKICKLLGYESEYFSKNYVAGVTAGNTVSIFRKGVAVAIKYLPDKKTWSVTARYVNVTRNGSSYWGDICKELQSLNTNSSAEAA